MKVPSSPPTLEALAPLPQLNPLPKLEPILLPQPRNSPVSSIEPSGIYVGSKEVAAAVADRLVSEIVPHIQPAQLEQEKQIKQEPAPIANVFETKVKLVGQKVTKQVEELKEMPEKVINDTIEKLSLELNSVTNDVLSALNSTEENIIQQVNESPISNKQTKIEEMTVKSENITAPAESLQDIIESIPVALNNVAANITPKDESESVFVLSSST